MIRQHQGHVSAERRVSGSGLMNLYAAHRVATMCILGNISYRIGRPIEWDGANQRIKNDPAANRLLGGPGRGMWHL